MEMIGDYKLADKLTTRDAGYSMWGFAEKDGKKYFLKQFLSPKYPVDAGDLSEKQIQMRLHECRRFEKRQLKLYETINECSQGNLVHVEQFFRAGSKYYVVMEAYDALPWEQVLTLPQDEKCRICRVLIHAVSRMHIHHLVHGDLKKDNILLCRVVPEGRHVTARIIDLDDAWWENDPPGQEEELRGDQVYFAPEVYQYRSGEHVKISSAGDVFSLGLVLHELFTGELPHTRQEEDIYPALILLEGEELFIHTEIPEPYQTLIRRMLVKDPKERITLMQAEDAIRSWTEGTVPVIRELSEIGVTMFPETVIDYDVDDFPIPEVSENRPGGLVIRLNHSSENVHSENEDYEEGEAGSTPENAGESKKDKTLFHQAGRL